MKKTDKQEPLFSISPREVADKSLKNSLKNAIRMALDIESEAVRLNVQTFNQKRYLATAEIDDYEDLKDQARVIKEKAINNLPALLDELKQSIQERGGHFYLARNSTDACNYITQICFDFQAKLVVKAKSMTTEEIKLNQVLEREGIEVTETDLAEFILQVADEPPSHIVAPAIHRSRQRISTLFKQVFNPDCPLETGAELTKFARDRLREKFLNADIGITGANVIAADSGTLLLVESEGNIRMVTIAPDIHIAVAGIEKIVPSWTDLAPFIELLAPSATGQPLSSYTSLINPPLDMPSFSFDRDKKEKREFYLVLIDNGRFLMREDPILREALYCIRCSACLNSCANFQSLGGHAFGGETYSGGIGVAWEAGTGNLKKARFNELCTGCSRCVAQCPVRIDIPWLNENIRNRINISNFRLLFSSLQKQFFGNYHLFARWGSFFAPISNFMIQRKSIRIMGEKIIGISRKRKLLPFVSETLTQLYQHKQKRVITKQFKAVLFADVYTNYLYPGRGMATIEVLEKMGVNIVLSEVKPAGRSSLSQGKISKSSKHARQCSKYLKRQIDDGYDIIVIEPSILALFRHDYRFLIDDETLFWKLSENSYDPVEYIQKVVKENNLHLNKVFSREKILFKQHLFFHGHCQQKATLTDHNIVEFFENLGFIIKSSNVECCGMAGSFGYKKDFYDVSVRVGEDLFSQIEDRKKETEDIIIMTSGISCSDQILSGTGYSVLHPMELLANLIKC